MAAAGEMRPEPRIDGSAFLAEGSFVLGRATVGAGTGIWYNAVVRADAEPIRIGARVSVQDNAVVHVSPGYPCSVGDDVTIGHGAIVHGCTVDDRVIVGMGAIVMNGAHVGSDSIVGAGAVVTQGMDIPAGSVVVGSPARVLRPASDDDKAFILRNAAHYVELARAEREARS
ncbi:MAG: gamma carbonic anhydrase family protein [Atopobiaceae bacterium]|jgi:carbonic anhydrase/acetyltransferase-like protein (isoleucine patch superfamily)|nr:gamma carbonic anhydrase family protein [Atopobiaceae bacterium]MCH4119154.1 gamma carbonic anhydrase family protein [Atopobiaceae bacterium]MCI1318780.1 gamma carbonic anhydrase family protein [Atopobiaceae bacterium]MCI1388587.1 gamma carbonic anhydrase family protein [Atopobiaceae bacterium]MCI1432086.1 gamma carbonic anhydrase family protein [Atopobiaceae bacterium]